MFIIFSVVTLICLILDAFSLVCIAKYDDWNHTFVHVMCRVYLCSVIISPGMALIYMVVDFVKNVRKYKLIVALDLFLMAIGWVLICTLPIEVHKMGIEDITSITRYKSDYTAGPAVLTTYAFAVTYVLSIFGVIIVKRAVINIKKLTSILVWITAWLIAAFLQFINNQIIVVGFGLSIGIVMIYMNLENPVLYIDNVTAAFNQQALNEYIPYLYDKNSKFECFSVSFGSTQKKLLLEKNNKLLIKLASYLKRNSNCNIFITDDRNFVIVNNKVDIRSNVIIEKIINDFYGSKNPLDENIILNPRIALMMDPYIMSSAEDIFGIFKFLNANSSYYREGFIAINEANKNKYITNVESAKLLTEAIESNLFRVFYQPIYSLKTKKFESLEALVRIIDKEGNVIRPTDFIPAAEQNGSIVKIGEIVFENVCKFISENDLDKLGVKYIEVNLSMVQCMRPMLADKLLNIMKGYNVDSKYINFEITESASGNEKNIMQANIDKLMEAGITFSLDDFGTGNSNLNYIIDLPVKIVKFDKVMVDSYFTDKKAKHVMESSIRMLNELKYEIVLEGIETKEQLDVVSKLNVDFIQGYYFSRPVAENDVIDFLKENNN